MARRDYQEENCALARALGIIGDAWTLMILREAFLGSRRFADFQQHLAIPKNVLSQRLQHLTSQEIMEKTDAGTHGQRYEYVLTRKGKDLLTVMTALRQWGDRWIFGEGNEPALAYDRATGQPLPRVAIRREDGSQVTGSELELRPGPGADQTTRDRLKQLTHQRDNSSQA